MWYVGQAKKGKGSVVHSFWVAIMWLGLKAKESKAKHMLLTCPKPSTLIITLMVMMMGFFNFFVDFYFVWILVPKKYI